MRIVHKGRRYVDPSFMAGPEGPGVLPGEGLRALTQKEREVLSLLGEGLTNRQIAERLFVTEFTVKKHVGQVLAKLGLPDRTQAALYANTVGVAHFALREGAP